MFTVTHEHLDQIAPARSGAAGERQQKIKGHIAKHLPAVQREFEIDTKQRLAHFIAQLAQESDGFCAYEEYASGAAYEGRADLGNDAPGDGRRYKGRGPIQLTGKDNYRRFGGILGVDLIDDPDDPHDDADPMRAAEPATGLRIAGAYWRERGLNALADRNDIRGITKRINGGLNGFADRRMYWQRALAAFEIAVTSGAPAMSADLLKIGSRGADVLTLQTRLDALRYFPGDLDGKFGPKVDTQVRAFQRDQGLEIDGRVRVGGPTWTALEQAVEAQETAPVAEKRANTGVIELAAEGSRIAGSAVKGVSASIGGFIALAAATATEFSDRWPGASGKLEELMEPFGGSSELALGALAIAVAYSAWQHVQAGRARAEDHRKGKTA